MSGRSRTGSRRKARANQTSRVLVESGDKALQEAAAEVIASGEATGKTLETTMLHHPAKLRPNGCCCSAAASGKTFSASDLRRLAGAAVRTFKSGVCAVSLSSSQKTEGKPGKPSKPLWKGHSSVIRVRHLQSDRKDQKIDALTVIAKGDQGRLQKSLDEARIVWRIAELYPRVAERALQPDDANRSGRTGQEDGAGSRICNARFSAPIRLKNSRWAHSGEWRRVQTNHPR